MHICRKEWFFRRGFCRKWFIVQHFCFCQMQTIITWVWPYFVVTKSDASETLEFISFVWFCDRIGIKLYQDGINLILLSSYNYFRGFIWFVYNASWHWTMVCRNWEFQWMLPTFSCNVWVISIQCILCGVWIYDSINPFLYLEFQHCFTFLACFFCIHFFIFCF